MAIAFDNSTSNGVSQTTAPTVSFTVGSGTNRLLFVGLTLFAAGDVASAPTYAGTTMTLVTKINRADANNGQNTTYLWYLANPTTGANNIVFSYTGNVFRGYAISSYTGASQSGIPDASNTASVSGVGFSNVVSVTSVADNCWALLYAMADVGSGTLTAGTGATDRGTSADGFGNAVGIYDSNSAITPAGSYSMTLSRANNSNGSFLGIMASFAPPTTATTGNNMFQGANF